MNARRIAAVATLASAGCLSAPTGLAPSDAALGGEDDAVDASDEAWPPADLSVAAIATGDLTGDGRDDLVLVSTPAGADASVLLIDGATGLDYSKPGLIARARAIRPLDGSGPVGVTIVGGQAVIAYARAGTMRLATFTGGDLHVVGDLSAAVAAPAGAVWVDEITFPGNAGHVVLGAGPMLVHIATAELASTSAMVPPVPPPGGGGPPPPPWTASPVAVASYAAGNDRVIAVMTEASLDRSTIPTAPPPTGMFAWTNLRAAPAWDGQRRVELDGDQVPEVVGLTRDTPPQLCTADTSTGMIACAASLLPPGGVITAGQLTPDAMADLVVVQAAPSMTTLAVLPNPALAGTTLTLNPPVSITRPNRAVAALAALGHGRDAIVAIDAAGDATCHLVGIGSLTSCEAPP